MTAFPVHTIESAPDESKPLLEDLQARLGMVPHLAAAMSESPQLLKAFLTVREIYQGSTLSGVEVEVLSLTAAFENGCAWCMAFHTMMARRQGLSEDSVSALREGRAPIEPRLAALSDFARQMVRQRGGVAGDALDSFMAAGYARAQALDVVLGMGFSVMANYAGHLTGAPLNESLAAYEWRAKTPA